MGTSLNQNIAGFDLPNLPGADRLQNILTAALKIRLDNSPGSSEKRSGDRQYWDANFFNLDKVKIFQESTPAEQAAILEVASYSAIAESYSIEKAGIGYMAKMVLLAETTEERMLYSLFAADETTHLAQISQFLPSKYCKNLSSTTDPFLSFLADLVETQDKNVLLFVIQVVLEGWGLNHYRSLAKNCQEPQLGQIFNQFLQDEARHHGSGIMLFKRADLSRDSYQTIIEAMSAFLYMVRIGPQGIMRAIAQVKGHLSRAQKLQIFTEIDTETHSGSRLQLLRSLMQGAGATSIIQELEERGTFQPFPPGQCV
jgi:tRNA isopentenyl-2-thiomethyl-A-37 hydroxylase MiaE